VNNVLGFPGIFRGVLNAQAEKVTHPMLVAAAEAIASCTKPGDLVPQPLDRSVHERVAEAVEKSAMAEKQEIH
jgi:malate dehydrogenase (oxaloacetate-decarboxylating)